MYSVRPFPNWIRAGFVLLEDPYDPNAEKTGSVFSFLRELGVVFYRDEDNPRGLIFDELESLVFPMKLYKCTCALDADELKVLKWETPTAENRANHGDDMEWWYWNREVMVQGITPTEVTII